MQSIYLYTRKTKNKIVHCWLNIHPLFATLSQHLTGICVMSVPFSGCRSRILAQVTIYRRLLIGRDGHLDQSEAYAIS